MSTDLIVNLTFICAILALIAKALHAFFIGSGKKASPVKEVDLQELSKLWRKGGTKKGEIVEIPLEKLVPLWRDVKPTDASPQVDLALRYHRAADFWRDNIRWFKQAPLQKEVCSRILSILDQEGGCSSVVNAREDVESSWDSDTFKLLGLTTLMDHTLNVAEETIKLLVDQEAWHVIPDALVAALAHDLGKLPSLRTHLYSLGEHPLAAGSMLASIEKFKELSKKEEISKAIKLHHKKAEGLLGKTLKRADQLARQKELERAIEGIAKVRSQGAAAAPAPVAVVQAPVQGAVMSPTESGDMEVQCETPTDPSTVSDSNDPVTVKGRESAPTAIHDEPAAPGVSDEPVERVNPVPRVQPDSHTVQSAVVPIEPAAPVLTPSSQPTGAAAAWQAQRDIYGDDEEESATRAKKQVLKMANISHWFDPDAFLESMKPYINKVTGRRFMAFSMSDGIIYFQAKVLEEVARKQAEQAGAMDVVTLASDDPTMREILMSVVNHFRVDRDIIARGMIKDAFFGGYFTVKKKDGPPLKGFYTPFDAEAFGSIAQMENEKPEKLQNLLSIEPTITN